MTITTCLIFWMPSSAAAAFTHVQKPSADAKAIASRDSTLRRLPRLRRAPRSSVEKNLGDQTAMCPWPILDRRRPRVRIPVGTRNDAIIEGQRGMAALILPNVEVRLVDVGHVQAAAITLRCDEHVVRRRGVDYVRKRRVERNGRASSTQMSGSDVFNGRCRVPRAVRKDAASPPVPLLRASVLARSPSVDVTGDGEIAEAIERHDRLEQKVAI